MLSWYLHIDNIMKRSTSVCYMIRVVKPYMSFSSLKMIYSSLFHSVLSHGIIFWGLSSSSNKLFKLQKRVVRIMTGQGNRTSCRELFKKLEILPLKSQYIFSILLFVVNNKISSLPIMIVITYGLDRVKIFTCLPRYWLYIKMARILLAKRLHSDGNGTH
jgi:hypothetical protein